MRTHRLYPMVLLVVLFAAACSPDEESSFARAGRSPSQVSTASSISEDGGYAVDVDPADFVDRIDNRYFPLEPGTVFRLRGVTQDGIEYETVRVTDRTRTVMGVRTTVVKDVMRTDGKISEWTHDWYAQDREGNVWYFGEETAEYANGKILNRHGSWEAGVDGALPGIIMSGSPQVTDSFRQEFYEDEAEDMFWVVAAGETLSVPMGRFDDTVRVLEWTPLEPRIVVTKTYAPGVGLLSERALSGGKENVELSRCATRNTSGSASSSSCGLLRNMWKNTTNDRHIRAAGQPGRSS